MKYIILLWIATVSLVLSPVLAKAESTTSQPQSYLTQDTFCYPALDARPNMAPSEQESLNANNCTQENPTLIARSGCCSWHGGVCGCDAASDRIVCCDGTLSPSCTCGGY
ncbi:MAG TPA: hypothetical protein DDW49_09580 [Deltaproteobacteria bacterium]|nr:hypothetical protein [Deltaproteobacteria bacterium]